MDYKGSTLDIKQGETFSFSGAVVQSSDKTAVDTSDLTATSQIRRDNPGRELLAELTCQFLADSVLHVFFDGDTKTWPHGNYLWDICLTDNNGQVRTTQTVDVHVTKAVTQEA